MLDSLNIFSLFIIILGALSWNLVVVVYGVLLGGLSFTALQRFLAPRAFELSAVFFIVYFFINCLLSKDKSINIVGVQSIVQLDGDDKVVYWNGKKYKIINPNGLGLSDMVTVLTQTEDDKVEVRKEF